MSLRDMPSPDQTAVALRCFVGEVENVANGNAAPPMPFGGGVTDDLDLVTRELFDAHPLTQVLVAITSSTPR